MNTFDHNDDDLRRRFHKLAARDAESAPGVSGTLIAARSRAARVTRKRRWYVAGLIGATSVAVVAIVVVRQQSTPLIDLSASRWVAPTDFLLNTPGRSLLQTVPSFTVTPLQSSSRAASPRRTTPRNDS
jgi:hypothetical protein